LLRETRENQKGLKLNKTGHHLEYGPYTRPVYGSCRQTIGSMIPIWLMEAVNSSRIRGQEEKGTDLFMKKGGKEWENKSRENLRSH